MGEDGREGLEWAGVGYRGPRMGREYVWSVCPGIFTLFEITVYDVHIFGGGGEGGGENANGY